MKVAFNPKVPIFDVQWLVSGLIPLNGLGIFLSPAGVGKSFLVEQLIVSVVTGTPFCGMLVKGGSVLLIDRDTPEDVLRRRLNRLIKGTGRKLGNHKLYIKSMGEESLDNGKLVECILEHNEVVLVVMDSLHSLLDHYNPNSTQDMTVLSHLKKRTLRKNLALVLTHHVSEKVVLSVDELMSTQNLNVLTMGSSVINQQADTLYYLASPDRDGELKTLYVRPRAKRYMIPQKPFILRFLEFKTRCRFKMKGLYEAPMYEVDKDVLSVLNTTRPLTVNETVTKMGGKHSVYAVRNALPRLISMKLVKELRVSPKRLSYRKLNKKEKDKLRK